MNTLLFLALFRATGGVFNTNSKFGAFKNKMGFLYEIFLYSYIMSHKLMMNSPVGYVKRGCLIVHFLVGVVFVKHHSDGEFTSSLARFQQQGDRDNIVDLGDEVAVLVARFRLKSDQILERVDTVPWYDKFIQRTDNNGSLKFYLFIFFR
jgi:hypothetical protein